MAAPNAPPKSRPPRYRLYVDESGDHAYCNLDHVAHRFLALLGVWFRQPEAYTEFADQLEEMKRTLFGPRPDKPVILHRSDIINRKGVFGLLCDDAIRQRFDTALLKVITDARFTLVCVVIDKKSHNDRYASPFHPYHYCLAAMLERYTGWLNLCNAIGDVMAESRGKEEDLQLAQSYRRFYEAGTQWHRHEAIKRALTTKEIKLERKRANIAGLQLADVLAHPIKRHCLVHHGVIPDSGDDFGKEVVAAVMDKFNRQVYQNRIDGYGRVWL